jgi:hypothetical protein
MCKNMLKKIRVAANWIQTILDVRMPMDRANGLHTR